MVFYFIDDQHGEFLEVVYGGRGRDGGGNGGGYIPPESVPLDSYCQETP